MALFSAQHLPGSTYRLQLHAQFTFADLAGIAPYLHALGVTDCYCSPILSSTPGSTHGYDVSDYRQINPELGGDAGFTALAAALRENGLGLMLDFVPNHMGINGPFNRWWLNVLEFGRQSPYARFFDVHWKGEGVERARILVPVLEDHYGVVLEAGGLKLACEEGMLRVRCGDLYFPLNPAAYARVLGPVTRDPRCPPGAAAELGGFLEELGALTAGDAPLAEEGMQRMDALRSRLRAALEADAGGRRLVGERLAALNGHPGEPRSFDEWDAILQEQNYRLARWKTGVYAANYRRFFAIDTLVGLRVENPEVFAESHALLATILAEGKVTGLRIDHVDGLWDPQQYFERLQGLARGPGGPEAGHPLYVVVEKILARGENLAAAWPIHGTTGYEFMSQCGRLFTRASAEAEITGIYREFTGPVEPFPELVHAEKRFVLEEMFANTVAQLAIGLSDILVADRRRRDLTRRELAIAVRETMAALRVYRTYRRLGEPSTDQDRREIAAAYEEAVRRNPLRGVQPLQLVRDILSGDYPPADFPEDYRLRLNRWVLGFQQYTGGVMAKAVEDTAFYVYNRLIALNEVGGDPAEFGGTIAEFHADNAERARQTPHALVATSTHDSKLSEDARARLYALSEIPEDWGAWLKEWREINRGRKTAVEGQAAPDANEEYRLYQALLAAWPLGERAPDEAFRERIRSYFRKAVNEAKLNTTWIQPNEGWLAAGDRFIDAILSPETGRAFLDSFQPRAARLAHLGMVNSLAQVVLKFTSPGVPDLYQGNELWDFSLVDPDNRRPVDFPARAALLLGETCDRPPRELLQDWRDGRIKLRVTRDLLRFRRGHRALFAFGGYVPLEAKHRLAEHVAAFRRDHEGESLLVAVPRLTAKLGCPPIDLMWEDTAVAVGGGKGAGWKDVLTGREFGAGEELPMRELFADLPFAVLYRKR